MTVREDVVAPETSLDVRRLVDALGLDLGLLVRNRALDGRGIPKSRASLERRPSSPQRACPRGR